MNCFFLFVEKEMKTDEDEYCLTLMYSHTNLNDLRFSNKLFLFVSCRSFQFDDICKHKLIVIYTFVSIRIL